MEALRELRRTLHLADRAVRQRTAQPPTSGPGHRSAYERLNLLSPELGHAVQKPAVAEQKISLPSSSCVVRSSGSPRSGARCRWAGAVPDDYHFQEVADSDGGSQ
jgi:hypothetical protein